MHEVSRPQSAIEAPLYLVNMRSIKTCDFIQEITPVTDEEPVVILKPLVTLSTKPSPKHSLYVWSSSDIVSIPPELELAFYQLAIGIFKICE